MIGNIITTAVHDFGLILILMLIDLVTGLIKATRIHESIRSNKLRSSVNKAITYFIILLIGGCVSYAGEPGVSGIFKVFLVLVEGVSICENLIHIFPESRIVEKIKGVLNKEIDKK